PLAQHFRRKGGPSPSPPTRPAVLIPVSELAANTADATTPPKSHSRTLPFVLRRPVGVGSRSAPPKTALTLTPPPTLPRSLSCFFRGRFVRPPRRRRPDEDRCARNRRPGE